MPLSAQHDNNLELTDKSLYKRLQYAKEILVQMMSVASMPPTLALNNQAAAMEGDKDGAVAADEFNNYQSQQKMTAYNQHQSARHTKSASKGAMMMSPYNSKTTLKAKEQARSYRMQTMTAHKAQTSTNLLNSNIKQQQQAQNQQSKNKFELPMLSNRSNSR